MKVKGIKVRHVSPRPANVRRHCASIGLAKELIGFKPTVCFEDGLKMTIKWYIETIRKERI